MCFFLCIVFSFFPFLFSNLVVASTWCDEAQIQNQSCIIVLLVGSDMKDNADPDTKSGGGLIQYLLIRLHPFSSHLLSPQLLVKQVCVQSVFSIFGLVKNINSYFRHIEPVILGMRCLARSPGGSDAHSLLLAPTHLTLIVFWPL